MPETSTARHTRRRFLRHLAAATASAPAWPRLLPRVHGADAPPPIRPLTRGPKFHWFGYYDKLEFDPTGRFVLANEVMFEHRSPRPGDVIKVGMVDTADKDKWIELGESRAWNWQQGCMLQWLPGSADEVLWNDRDGERFVCHVLNVQSGKQRTLPHPVYALSPDGKWAIATDFRRLNDCRPGYGYAGIPDPHKDTLLPEDAGIWRVDMQTGRSSLLLSFADVARVPQPGGFSAGAKHWFNHLLVAPGTGRRFTFLHRWRGAEEGRIWKTRMFTANADGSELHLLIPNGRVSHFNWRDPTHILAYAGLADDPKAWKFQLIEDRSSRVEIIEGMLERDGHCSYLPGNKWILCDSYPDADRKQNLYLLHVKTHRRHPLSRFDSPKVYSGEWRCDLHPRFSPDGKKVTIDSPHEGGRQVYWVDISEIVA